MYIIIQQNQKHLNAVFPNVSNRSYSSPIIPTSPHESEWGEQQEDNRDVEEARRGWEN